MLSFPSDIGLMWIFKKITLKCFVITDLVITYRWNLAFGVVPFFEFTFLFMEVIAHAFLVSVCSTFAIRKSMVLVFRLCLIFPLRFISELLFFHLRLAKNTIFLHLYLLAHHEFLLFSKGGLGKIKLKIFLFSPIVDSEDRFDRFIRLASVFRNCIELFKFHFSSCLAFGYPLAFHFMSGWNTFNVIVWSQKKSLLSTNSWCIRLTVVKVIPVVLN